MKINHPLLLLALLALGNPGVLHAQTFARTYGEPGGTPASGYRCATTPDGKIATILYEAGSFGLLCTDAAGNTLWKRAYSNSWLTDIAATEDDEFAVCGGSGGRPFAMKVLSGTGDVVWAKTFGGLSGVYRAVHADLTNGNITAVGEVQNSTLDVIFTTVSSIGRVQIQTQHGTAFENDTCWDVDQRSDGGFILVSTTNFNGTGDRNVWIKHIGVTGVLLGAVEIGTPGQDGFTAKPRVAVLDNGDIIVSAGHRESNTKADDIWIVTLDSLLAVQQEVAYGLAIDRPVDVRATQDGGYAVLAQAVSPADPLSDALLMKFQPNGSVDFITNFGGNANDYPGGLAEAGNGDLIISGTAGSFGTQDVWLLRVDATGEASPCCTVQSHPNLSGKNEVSAVSTTGTILAHPSVIERSVAVVPSPTASRETAQCATNYGAWQDLGLGTPGQNGTPCLSGVGRLTAGTFVRHILDGAEPSAPMVLVIGFSRWDLPVFGGTLAPSFDLLVFGMTSPQGTSGGQSTWPGGIPAGFTFHTQYLVRDPGGPDGWAFSNAITAVTP